MPRPLLWCLALWGFGSCNSVHTSGRGGWPVFCCFHLKCMAQAAYEVLQNHFAFLSADHSATRLGSRLASLEDNVNKIANKMQD